MFASLLVAGVLLVQELAAPAAAPPPPIRVACIGDSITFGARLEDREHHSYPAQLSYLLGEEYEVRNFGVGGATLLREADRPIHKTDRFAAMLAWKPQLAVVILGTNDTCENERRRNWSHEAALEHDATELIQALIAVGVEAVQLAAPPPMTLQTSGLTEERLADLQTRSARLPRIEAAYRSVAEEHPTVRFLDLAESLQAHWTSDGVHPTPFGCESIALRVATAVLGESPTPSLFARPSAEYRGSSAGWGGGNWHGALAHLKLEAAANPEVPVVFLGDSITQGLTGHASRTTTPGGTRAIDRAFGERGAISLGLSGDRTEHLLYRIQHGALPLLRPEVIVLQIGINNINSAKHDAQQTAAGIDAVVRLLRDEQPQARVILCGPFPAGRAPDDPRRAVVNEVHSITMALGSLPKVDYLDLRPLFLNTDRSANANLSNDGIHITAAGKEAWMSAITTHLQTQAEAGPAAGSSD